MPDYDFPAAETAFAPCEKQRASDLASVVSRNIHASFDAHTALSMIAHATGGDFYLFGGTLRRALFGEGRIADLDIVVPNGDLRIIDLLDQLRIPLSFTSKGHHRYQWNKLQIDICHPSEFFTGFLEIREMLQFVDLKINSLAFHYGNGEIVDPFRMLRKRSIIDPEVNWNLWRIVTAKDILVLCIRLARILYETPSLFLPSSEVDKVLTVAIPLLEQSDWEPVQYRFPAGRTVFIETFRGLLEARCCLPQI